MAIVATNSLSWHAPWTAVLHDWVTTVDHKKDRHHVRPDGLVFLVVGGCEALLDALATFLSAQHACSDRTSFNQLFTMHGTTMVFFVGMPILIGIGNYLVPLMIGARDMAFPRLNALGFWVTLFGGLLVYFSFATGGAPAIGWFAYAPLTERTFARGAATDFWALGLIVSGIGTLAAAINFIATILGMRAPGMTLRKVPFFVWTMLWTSVLILFAIPPLTAGLIMVLLDRNLGRISSTRRTAARRCCGSTCSGSSAIPEVYILILPVFGMISEMIPVFSRKVLFGYEFMAAADDGDRLHQPRRLGAPHVRRRHEPDGRPVLRRRQPAWSPIPTGIKFFNWLATMYGGRISLRLADAVRLRLPVDVPDRRADRHHAGGGPVRLSTDRQLFRRRPFSLGADRRHAVRRLCRALLLVSQGDRPDALGAAGPLAILAALRRLHSDVRADARLGNARACRGGSTRTNVDRGWEIWNQLTTIGAFIQVPSFVIFVYNLVVSLRNGKPAGDDPWDAWTLGMDDDLAAAVVQLRSDPDRRTAAGRCGT